MAKRAGRLSRRGFLAAGGAAVGLAATGCVTGNGEAVMREQASAFPWAVPEDAGVDPARLAKVTGFLDDELAKGSYPGACVVATRKGKTFVRHYVGNFCDGVTRDQPYGPEVYNFLYSFSKVVSATVIVMLHQDGLIDYDRPVAEYIPGFEQGGKGAITLRQMMTHSAGIPGVGLGATLTDEQWAAAEAELCAHAVEWAPGSKTLYHGTSSEFVPAAVARRVCGGKPWNDICKERLFDPLGMQSMTFAMPPADAVVAVTPQPGGLPWPFTAANYPVVGHPAGGALSRVEDMLRLLNLHLDGGVWRGKRLIEQEAFEEMHRVQYADAIAAALAAGTNPTHEYWALGWLTRGKTDTGWFGFGNVVSERAFGHAGISTVIGIADPETDLALAFLTTETPKSDAETIRLRNTVTNLVASSLT